MEKLIGVFFGKKSNCIKLTFLGKFFFITITNCQIVRSN